MEICQALLALLQVVQFRFPYRVLFIFSVYYRRNKNEAPSTYFSQIIPVKFSIFVLPNSVWALCFFFLSHIIVS